MLFLQTFGSNAIEFDLDFFAKEIYILVKVPACKLKKGYPWHCTLLVQDSPCSLKPHLLLHLFNYIQLAVWTLSQNLYKHSDAIQAPTPL